MLVTRDVYRVADLMMSTKGCVAAYPTETFYGLGARLADRVALERAVGIKGRDAAKGMIVLVADLEAAGRVAALSGAQEAALGVLWPGAVSVLLEAAPGLDPLLAPQGKVALRISPHPQALELVRLAGPLSSTSANRTGMHPAASAREVVLSGLEVDAVLDGGETSGGLPSTLVDLTRWPPVCLREGAVPFSEILARLYPGK